MRVQEWDKLNARALVSVIHKGHRVELEYQHGSESVLLSEELQGLVTAEQDCCGAAGVTFELNSKSDRMYVSVKVDREGVPAKTVVDTFAAMKPR